MSDTTARLESDNPSIVGQFGPCKAGDKITITMTGEVTEHSTDKTDIKETGPIDAVMKSKVGPRHHLRLRMNVRSLEYSKQGAAKKPKAMSPGADAIMQTRRGY